MSVEQLALVLHHSQAKGTDKLVLLGIANHSGDGGAWPAIGTLARYANATERTVQRSLARLIELGELTRHVQEGGLVGWDDFTRPNRYDVTVACPPWCDRTAAHRDLRVVRRPVDKSGSDRVTPTSPGDAHVTGGGDAHVTLTTPVTPDTQVPASTTDRARLDDERPPTPANPPADELRKVREQLRNSSTETRKRDRGTR